MEELLINLCKNNEKYFKTIQSDDGAKFSLQFSKIIELLGKTKAVFKQVEKFASDYDFDEESPWNGYRSFVDFFATAVEQTEKVCRKITEGRESFFFRKSFYLK